jgi:hypothetical protein
VGVPGVAVLDGELAMPLAVGWFVDAVDVDVTALAEWDHVLDAIVGVVAVDVMERELRLASRSEVGLEPFFRCPTADHACAAPAVEDGFFK